MGIHCSVDHWAALTYDNEIAIGNWKRTLGTAGAFGKTRSPEVIRDLVEEMRLGRRPIDRSAMVMVGAMFPDEYKLRVWFKGIIQGTKRRGVDTSVAAIYALGAHLDRDQDLVDRFVVLAMKWQSFPQLLPHVFAINTVVSIWRTSAGSGTCDSCGKARGSPSTLKQPDSPKTLGS